MNKQEIIRLPDREYFEFLTFQVFAMFIGEKTVRAKWKAITLALFGFDVFKIARLSPDEISKIQKNPKIIRNLKKLKATVRNAREFCQIMEKFGSIFRYLQSFPNHASRLADLADRIHYIGKPSLKKFLAAIEIEEK